MIEFGQPSAEFKRLNPNLFGVGQQDSHPVPSTPAAPPKPDRVEKELQRLICLDLNRRKIFFNYSRTDQPTTTLVGTPDFGVPWNGRYIAIECKSEHGRQTPDQEKVQRQIEAQGGSYHLIRSFEEYLRIIS